MPTDRVGERRFKLVACAIIAVAIAVRFTRLGSNSFWVDEISVLAVVRSRHFLAHLRASGGPFEPPLHYALVWLTTRLPIGFEYAARIPAAIAGVVEVGALMMLAQRLTRRRDVALIAGAFLAVAPFAVRYSQENRYYTTFSALHLVSWWLLVRALDRRGNDDFVWWGLAAGALLLTHPFAPLVVVVQAVVVWWVARREVAPESSEVRASLRRGVLRAALAAGVVALPWFVWGAQRWIRDAIAGRSYALNLRAREPVAISFDLFKRATEWLLGNSGRWSILIVLLLALALGAVTAADPMLRRVTRWVVVYSVAFFVALVPLARVLNTYLAMRRIEFLVAPVMLVAAIGVVDIEARVRRRWNPRRAAGFLTATVAAVILLSSVAVVAYFVTEKTNYRSLVTVVGDARRDDLVVVGPVDERWPPAIREYLAWRGVHRRLVFVVPGHRPPELVIPHGRVVWITGSPPGGHAFRTRGLNSLKDLQVIAGDRTAPASILPWFVSTSEPRTDHELLRQLQRIRRLAVVLPPPTGLKFPWWLVTGR